MGYFSAPYVTFFSSSLVFWEISYGPTSDCQLPFSQHLNSTKFNVTIILFENDTVFGINNDTASFI